MRARNKFTLVLGFVACTLALLTWTNLYAAPVPPELLPENNCNPHTCWQSPEYDGYEAYNTNPSYLWEFGFETAGNPVNIWNPTTMPFGTPDNGVVFYDKPNDAAKKNKLVKDGELEIMIRKWSEGTTRCKDTSNPAIIRTPALYFKTMFEPEYREPFPKYKCVDR
jgi:hypothetical protein